MTETYKSHTLSLSYISHFRNRDSHKAIHRFDTDIFQSPCQNINTRDLLGKMRGLLAAATATSASTYLYGSRCHIVLHK